MLTYLTLLLIAPFISAVACPLWTALADKTKTHNYIMCLIQTLATIAIVSVMGISVVVQDMDDADAKNRLTITLVTITSVCFAFFGVPVLPLVDGGVLKILGKNKNQYGTVSERIILMGITVFTNMLSLSLFR